MMVRDIGFGPGTRLWMFVLNLDTTKDSYRVNKKTQLCKVTRFSCTNTDLVQKTLHFFPTLHLYFKLVTEL